MSKYDPYASYASIGPHRALRVVKPDFELRLLREHMRTEGPVREGLVGRGTAGTGGTLGLCRRIEDDPPDVDGFRLVPRQLVVPHEPFQVVVTQLRKASFGHIEQIKPAGGRCHQPLRAFSEIAAPGAGRVIHLCGGFPLGVIPVV